MTYELDIGRAAKKALDSLPPKAYLRIGRAIDALKDEPRPHGCKKLVSRAPLWRIREGDYRVIYAVFDANRQVKILQVSRRSEDTYDQ